MFTFASQLPVTGRIFGTGKNEIENISVGSPSPLTPLLFLFSHLCIILIAPQSQLCGGGYFFFFFVFFCGRAFSLCSHTHAGMLPVAKFSLRCLCLSCTGSVGIARVKIKDNKRRIVFLSNLHSGMWLLQYPRHAERLIFLVCAMFTLQPLR